MRPQGGEVGLASGPQSRHGNPLWHDCMIHRGQEPEAGPLQKDRFVQDSGSQGGALRPTPASWSWFHPARKGYPLGVDATRRLAVYGFEVTA